MKKTILFTALLTVFASACGESASTENQDKPEATSEIEQEGAKPFITTYDNGQPRIKGMMIDGKRDGLWVAFYENGMRWSEENYIDGKREGRTINFHPSGHLRYRGQYIDDKKVGLWQFYNEEGKLIKEENF